jgi:putative membrane protein
MSTFCNRFSKLAALCFSTTLGLSIVSCSNIPEQFILAQNTPAINSPSGNTTLSPGTTNFLPSLSPIDQEFMTKVAQSDMTVIGTSKLALQKSKIPAVRDFARQMIQKHTDSSKQLMQIAKVKGFKLPENIGSENQSLLINLMQVPSENFNRAYMNRQVQAHSKTWGEFQKYLQQGQDPNLKAFASKMSPVVAEHLNMAQKIAERL